MARGDPVKVLTDYEGRAVRLTDERMAHILEHPEMMGMKKPGSRDTREPGAGYGVAQ